jgi:hypothetical protein
MVTNAGREVVEGMYELGDRLHAKIKTLTRPEMERLLSLFDGVIANIKGLPQPAQKTAFKLSLLFDRGVATPGIVQIRQRIIVLLAFHDDAHMAAWHPYEVDGHLWETFTLVWQGQAGCAAELTEKLPHRNCAKCEYTSVLETLSARGWIIACGGRFIPQEQAARMRQAVEGATDRTFAAAFAGLSTTEMGEFRSLIRKLAAAVALYKEDAK